MLQTKKSEANKQTETKRVFYISQERSTEQERSPCVRRDIQQAVLLISACSSYLRGGGASRASGGELS